MKRLNTTWLSASCIATCLALTGCAGSIGKIADTLLANEVGSDDRELPQTAYAIPASADRIQMLAGQGSGLSCSLPWGAQTLAFTAGENQAPIALQMRQACAFHDYCYRHGNATYGYSQSDCDFLLQQHAFRICKYVNRERSVEKCETDARKLTLGVRLGGFKPFQRVRATDDSAGSTFFEFDVYPVRSERYQVLRIADAPEEWVRTGHLPKAAYHFDIRPSGSVVRVVGWTTAGGMKVEQGPIVLQGSYYALTAPPLVVRDAPGGKDWLVWWKRYSLRETGGRFAFLPAGQATRNDWRIVAGERLDASRETLSGPGVPLNSVGYGSKSSAFVEETDAFFSEVYAVQGANRPGQVRLAAITKNPCTPSGRWACLVNLEVDTVQQKLRVGDKGKPPMYTIRADNCANNTPPGLCNVYRNYVAAPYVFNSAEGPLVTWLVRGSGPNGRGYSGSGIVRSYSFGNTPDAPAVKRDVFTLPGFAESMEPAVLLDTTSSVPAFLSLESSKTTFNVHTRFSVPENGRSGVNNVQCPKHADRSWLQRPVAYVPAPDGTRRGFLVFSRVQLDAFGDADSQSSATLRLAITTVFDNGCSAQRYQDFPGFFKGPRMSHSVGKNMSEAKDQVFNWFSEKVRGGQLVIADVTGDDIPDVIQVTRMPDRSEFDTAVLVGALDANELRFKTLSSALD